MVPWFITIWIRRINIIFKHENVDVLNVFDLIKIRSWHRFKIKIGGILFF